MKAPSSRFTRRLGICFLAVCCFSPLALGDEPESTSDDSSERHEPTVEQNANRMIHEGRRTFRFDTFGDEAFWGDTLKLHQAIEGERFGGVGPGVSPRTALAVGLKVDLDALPSALVRQLRRGEVDLDDVAVTLTLLRLNAIIGVTDTSTAKVRFARSGFNAHSVTPPSIIRSRRGSASASMAGRAAI